MRWSETEYQAYLRFMRREQPAPVSEKAWQDGVMRVLKSTGHTLVYHTHDSRRSPSGWPDVAAIKPAGGTLYLCELKTDVGIVSEAQQAWLTALAGCTGVVAEVWRPSAMQETICERLRA